MKKLLIFLSITFVSTVFCAKKADKKKKDEVQTKTNSVKFEDPEFQKKLRSQIKNFLTEEERRSQGFNKAYKKSVELNLHAISRNLEWLRPDVNAPLSDGITTPYQHFYEEAMSAEANAVSRAAYLLRYDTKGEVEKLQKDPTKLDAKILNTLQAYAGQSSTLPSSDEDVQQTLNNALKEATAHLAATQELCNLLKTAGAQEEQKKD